MESMLASIVILITTLVSEGQVEKSKGGEFNKESGELTKFQVSYFLTEV